MIHNKEIPSEVFICGTKADRYQTPYGDGFRVKKFPFFFFIEPQQIENHKIVTALNLTIETFDGYEIWNEPLLIDGTDIIQLYNRAVEKIEIAAANFIEDLLSIRYWYNQPGPRVIK